MPHEEPKILLSTKDAARQMGCSLRNVQSMIERGFLPAIRVGRTYAIDPDHLHLPEVANRQRGTPGHLEERDDLTEEQKEAIRERAIQRQQERAILHRTGRAHRTAGIRH